MLIAFNGSSWIDLGTFANIKDLTDGGSADTLHSHGVVTIADESSDTTCFVSYFTAATGTLQPKTGTNLTFNSATGILTATGFAGALTGNVTGNADTATALATARTIGGSSFDGTANIVPGTITIADESADTTCFVGYFTAATGSLQPKTGTNLTFNSSSGLLTATGLTATGTGTDGYHVINQVADSAGLQINGYDDESGFAIKAYVNSAGTSYLESTSTFLYLRGNGANICYLSSTGLNYFNDKKMFIGHASSTQAGIVQSTAQTVDSPIFFVNDAGGTGSRSIIICDDGDINFDFAHAIQSTPTLFIHSNNQSTTQWIGFTHNGTNGVLSVGTGVLSVPGLASTPDEIIATSEGVAASLTTTNTEVTTNGDSDLDNVTLANGTSGQVKCIYCVAEGNGADTWKITPATMCGGTQITFSGVGEGCTLVYADNEGWIVTGNNGGTIT